MKKISILVVAIMFVFSGCSTNSDSNSNSSSNSDSNSNSYQGTIASLITGDVTGEVGKTYKTEWFNFSVNSMEVVESYKEHTPSADNYTFLVCNVTETNTWSETESLPMGAWDFYLDDDAFSEYIWAEEPWDDSMMPLEFELAPDETVTYDLVFEIPKGLNTINFMYTEVAEDDSEYATFTITKTFII